jgi:glycosyltransferase involved in cell wall biosynthesis
MPSMPVKEFPLSAVDTSAVPKLSVIVPLYNEARSARDVLSALCKKSLAGLDIELVLVESNSNDGTRDIVRSFETDPRVRVIYEDVPKGKGHAVRAGIAAATGDIILIQDADDEYSLEDYEKLIKPILDGRTAFVLGTRHTEGQWHMRRFSSGNHYAFIFNMAHWVFTGLLNVSLGVRMTDPFTMFKVFRRNCLNGLVLECNRFDFDWELVIKLVRAGYKPLEIPVYYKSRDFKEGKKVDMWKDPPLWLKAWWKYAVLKR